MKTHFNPKSFWFILSLLLLSGQVSAQTAAPTVVHTPDAAYASIYGGDTYEVFYFKSKTAIAPKTFNAATITQGTASWFTMGSSISTSQASITWTNEFDAGKPTSGNPYKITNLRWNTSQANRQIVLLIQGFSEIAVIHTAGSSFVIGAETYNGSGYDAEIATTSTGNGTTRVTLDPNNQYRITFRGATASNYTTGIAAFSLKVGGTTTTCTPSTTAFTSSTVSKNTADAPFTNALTGDNNSGTKTFTSSNTAVATVNATGQVSIFGAGTTTIRLQQPETSGICAVDKSYTLTVTSPGAGATSSICDGPEGFEEVASISGTLTPSSGSWTLTGSNNALGDAHTGSVGILLYRDARSITTPALENPTQISFWVKRTASSTQDGDAFQVTIEGTAITDGITVGGVAATIVNNRIKYLETNWVQVIVPIPVALSSSATRITITSGTRDDAKSSLVIDDVQATCDSSSPKLYATPISPACLYYNTVAATDNTGGNPTKVSFTLKGANLSASNATVTVPAGFQISTSGTGGWAASLTVAPAAGSIDQVIYVRIDPTNTANGTPATTVSFSHTDVAATAPVNICGEIVTLTPLACPTLTVDDVNFAGANISWNNITGNNGYIIKIYQAGSLLQTNEVALNTTSYSITGLTELTTFTVSITVKGNGSTSGNSVECAAQAFGTTQAPPSSSTVCWTEDFEMLAPSGNTESAACPAEGETTNELRYTTGSMTNCSNTFNLQLPSGIWANGTMLCAFGGTIPYNSSTRALGMYRGGSITLPVLDNAKTVSFYVRAAGSAPSANSTDRGFRLLLNGAAITTGIYANDVLLTTSTTAIPSLSSANDGTIRVSAAWTKITVEINSTTQTTLKIASIAGNSQSDIIIDDITVECSSMLLTAAPNQSGMNYVLDMGPSNTKTFTLSGTDLPNPSGTITLSNLGNFELSFDNGVTWTTGTTATYNYTAHTFAQAVMVRLKAGLSINDYSTTVSIACPGYTKTLPAVSFSGKVTQFPNTLPCGQEVVLARMRGTDESNILFDDIKGVNWTADVNTKSNHFLLKKSASLISPSIDLSEYDLSRLTFQYQPQNATSGSLVLSIPGTTAAPVSFNYTTNTAAYLASVDLHSVDLGGAGAISLQITAGSQTDVQVWEIELIGVPKRQISVSPPMLNSFASSSVDCPSEPQFFYVLGSCLEENSSINFTSTQYEFSRSESGPWAQVIPYTGKFPVGGMKVYVRQKGTALSTGFTVNETVKITNDGMSEASIVLSGEVTPPADMLVPGAVTFSSPNGVTSIRSIPLPGGEFCQPLTVSSNCPNLTLANCEGGSYEASTGFEANVDPANRVLYLKYTPGANLNCKLTLKSGSSYTREIPLTWTGATQISNGVATDNTDVQLSGGVGQTNVWKTGTLPDATTVSIATTGGLTVSMGNPAYGDFMPITSAKLGDLNGTLFIQGASGGTVTLTTAGGQTTTINVNP